jgi:hypothetical protein
MATTSRTARSGGRDGCAARTSGETVGGPGLTRSMPRLDLLFAHAADLHIDVTWLDLGEERRGYYLHDAGFIVLNRRLTRPQATAALAHEIGHAIHGDRCSTPQAERRATALGAALIITPRDYRRAERLVGSHAGALADELGVTSGLIEAWRQWYRQERRRRCERLADS